MPWRGQAWSAGGEEPGVSGGVAHGGAVCAGPVDAVVVDGGGVVVAVDDGVVMST